MGRYHESYRFQQDCAQAAREASQKANPCKACLCRDCRNWDCPVKCRAFLPCDAPVTKCQEVKS